MQLRKIILRVLLASLAISALAGATAMMFADDEVIWRIISTGLVTAVSSAMLLPLTWLLDKPKAHLAGLMGTGLMIAEYLLILALIWELAQGYSFQMNDLFLFLALTLPITGGLSMLGLALLNNPHTRWTSWTMLASCALAQIFFVIGVIGLVANFKDEPWWQTGWVILGYGLLCAICLVNYPAENSQGQFWRRWRPWPGIGASVVGASMAIVSICGIRGDVDPLFAGVVIAACLWAHGTLVLQANLKSGQRVLGVLVIAVLVLSGLCIEALMFEDVVTGSLQEGLARIGGATGILGACGSLALMVMVALNRRGQPSVASDESLCFSSLELFCPHCRTRQVVPLGEAHCKKCHLAIHTRIDEPRCEQCSYLLIGLTADHCPECGNVIK